MPTFTSPFTGDIVLPTDVSFQALALTANTQLSWPSYLPPNSGYVPLSRIINVTPSAAGFTITLPPANQGAVGTDVLFVNKGSFSFFVQNYGGGGSATIAVNNSQYYYLTDNSTTAGVWNNFLYGVGSGSINANDLAGPGLTNYLGQLATTNVITEISAPPTLAQGNLASAYVWTSGANSITLPTSASLNNGWFFLFRNNGTGAITFLPQGTSTINGSSSTVFNPGDSGTILFNKTNGNFYTVGLTNQADTTFTAATYDVDSIVGSPYSLVSNAPIIQTYVALSGTRSTNLLVTLPAVTNLYVLVNNTNQNAYTLSFQITGSSQTPIVLGAGSTSLVLSDSNFLYVLTQVGTGSFFANDGSASAPSFSFNSDTTSGMYLVSVGQLALTANAQQMLLINNSSLGNPPMSTPATFNAGLIGGGTF
jgi:hypothetical protein